MIYLKLFLLTIVIVYVVDLSGVVDRIKLVIASRIGVKRVTLHLFECSKCLTWWSCIGFAVFHGLGNGRLLGDLDLFVLAYTALLSYFSGHIGDLLRTLHELLAVGIIRAGDRISEL